MILAFDIGGSRIRAAVWQGDRLLSLADMPTPTQDRAAFVRAIGTCAAGRDVRGIAVAIAGIVDPETGIGTVANIPAAHGVALAPMLSEATGRPVRVWNDADCFVLAEARRGAGRGHGCVFGIILGTGIGGGLVLNGDLVTGAGGYSGEWGHGPVVRGDLAMTCGCGQTGCLETVGGARGLERLHARRTGQDLTAEAIVAGWQDGEAGCVGTLGLWRDLVSGPLAMCVNLTGAGIVPVGGGLSRAKGLVDWLDMSVRAQILRRTDRPLVVTAECGADAGLLGAALAGEAEWGLA